jgi:hypothetical protein
MSPGTLPHHRTYRFRYPAVGGRLPSPFAHPFLSGSRHRAGLARSPFRSAGPHPSTFRVGPGPRPQLSLPAVPDRLHAPAMRSSFRSHNLLRSFASPPLRGFFATMTSADFSPALAGEISPSKVPYLSPRAARLYLTRLDGLRVSPSLTGSPPVPGLAAGSCSCGRGFAFRFLRLHLAATPCGSAQVGSITSFKYVSTC